jgi:hypothetical protein
VAINHPNHSGNGCHGPLTAHSAAATNSTQQAHPKTSSRQPSSPASALFQYPWQIFCAAWWPNRGRGCCILYYKVKVSFVAQFSENPSSNVDQPIKI